MSDTSDTGSSATNQADNTQIGSGQMFPDDVNDDYSVINFIARQAIAEMETCTPVQIKAVHAGSGSPPAGGTVDVQLLVSLLDGNGKATKQGVVYGIPYMRLQSKNWSIIAEPSVGDYGFIISASRDISNVVRNPGQKTPGSFRMHSFSDGFFIPCPFNGAAPGASIWLKDDGTMQLTTKDGVVIKSSGGNLDVTSTTTTYHGDVHVTGAIIAGYGGGDQVGLQTHKHAANNTPPTPGF